MMNDEHRFPFTEARIRNLPFSTGGQRVTYHDLEVPGLSLRVASTTKTFQLFRRVSGRVQRMIIGRAPTWTVRAAQDRVRELTGDIARGKNPTAERRALRETPTVADSWTTYQTWADGRLTTSTIDNFTRWWEQRIKPVFGNRRMQDVTPSEVQVWHSQLGKTVGKPTANRCHCVLRRLYYFAAARGYDGRNPCRGVERFPEQSRSRFLAPEEVGRMLQALEHMDCKARDYFLLLMLTGARRSALASMRWTDVDLSRGLWTVPPWSSKNKRELLLPLVGKARAILEQRRAADPTAQWVFPARQDPKGKVRHDGHLVEVKRQWRHLRAAAGLDGVRLHDLRRTVGAWLSMRGAPLQLVGEALGHRSLQAAAVYGRMDRTTVAVAMEGVTAALMATATPAITTDMPAEDPRGAAVRLYRAGTLTLDLAARLAGMTADQFRGLVP